MRQKTLLLILDGWGYNPHAEGNAIKAAKTPNFDYLWNNYPHCLLNASGVHVGLPEGIMGNSEVGHENIGAGRINKQKLTLISDMVKSGEFFSNLALKAAIAHAKNNNSKLHLMGLISEGDVHSHLGHLDALIEMAQKEGLSESQLYLHAISDGRDDPPYVAAKLMSRYEKKIQIATVAGRYWAMDRDNNWDRIAKYLQAVLNGQGLEAASAEPAITQAYALAKNGGNTYGDSDEFVLPTIIDSKGLITANDSVIFFNFRPDRAKQISQKLGIEKPVENLLYTCFTDYGNTALPIAFSDETLPEQEFSNTLGELVSKAGLKQLRIAETEKYNHVTMFFNSRKKKPYPNEDRILIPSPKVATYDLQPEMSLPEVKNRLIEEIKRDYYDLIVCNWANPDMVGHTGKWDAVVSAIEHVDKSLAEVFEIIKEHNYLLIVTADHGNADQMYDRDGSLRTAHSTNLVPCILVNSQREIATLKAEGNLSELAPTIVKYLDLEQASEMSSKSLV